MLLLYCSLMSALRDVGMREEKEKKEKETKNENERVSMGNMAVLGAIAWSSGLASSQATIRKVGAIVNMCLLSLGKFISDQEKVHGVLFKSMSINMQRAKHTMARYKKW